MAVTPTKLGWLFHAALVLLGLSALTSQSGLLLLFVGVLLGCALANVVVACRAVKLVELHPPPSVHLCEGGRMPQPWRVVNSGRGPACLIQVMSPAGVLLSLREVAAGAQISAVPELIYHKRGVFSNAALRVASKHPFGLVQARRGLDLPGEIVVGPAVYPVPAPHAAGYDVMLGGKFKGHRRCTSGTYFSGVRPFQDGDPLKQIHWKSSAKGQGMMVKTFDEELAGRVACIMDCGRAGQDKVFDDCVRAAGSLLFAALDEGHHVEWIDLHHLEPLLVPPFADGQEILDTLARVELAKGSLTEKSLQAAVDRLSRRSGICLVLTEFNPEVRNFIAGLLAQRRLVALYLPLSAEATGDLPAVPVFRYTDKEILEG